MDNLLPNKLTKLRKKCRFTQQQIAEYIGVDRSTYAGYETGKSHPPIDKRTKLSKIYSVPLSFLMTDETEDFLDTSPQIFSPNIANDIASEITNPIDYIDSLLAKTYFELTAEEKDFLAQYRLLNKNQKLDLAMFLGKMLSEN